MREQLAGEAPPKGGRGLSAEPRSPELGGGRRPMADATPPVSASLPHEVDWRKFLTDYPPGIRASVDGAIAEVENNGRPKIALPELQIYCDVNCRGLSYCTGTLRAVGVLFPGPPP